MAWRYCAFRLGVGEYHRGSLLMVSDLSLFPKNIGSSVKAAGPSGPFGKKHAGRALNFQKRHGSQAGPRVGTLPKAPMCPQSPANSENPMQGPQKKYRSYENLECLCVLSNRQLRVQLFAWARAAQLHACSRICWPDLKSTSVPSAGPSHSEEPLQYVGVPMYEGTFWW